MKKTTIPLFILTLLFGLVACGDDEPTPEPTVTVITTAVSPTSTPAPIPTPLPPTAAPPPVTSSTDGSIAYNTAVDGGIISNGRSLWTFKANSGDYIYVTIAPASGFDAVLDIIDQNGDSILPLGAVDDSFGEEITDIQIPADGQYQIAVSGFGDSNGRYQLTLSTNLNTPINTNLPNGTISQWASFAIASSEFSDESWAAFQAEGAPDTYDCGDSITAWAAAKSSTVEWIELHYDIPVEVTEINIYQSYNPDQVVAVELLATDGKSIPVFTQAQTAEENCPYILSLAVNSNFASDGIRITIDQSALNDWTEIDAVELIGLRIDDANAHPANETAVDALPNGVLWRIGGVSGYEDEPVGHLGGAAYDAERSRIYVTDSSNGIIVMNESGETIDVFTTDSPFFSPGGIALDAIGNIYVTNKSFIDDRGRIVVFSPEGELLHEYGSNGTGDGQFGILSPTALAVAADGTTYVFDHNKNKEDEIIYRIQKFSADGTFQSIIPIDTGYTVSHDTPMAIDDDGFVYFAEWINGTIIKIDSDGNVVKEISRGDGFYYTSMHGMDVDAAGNIYTVVWDEPAILKLDPYGNELAAFGLEVENGEAPWPAGSFYWPNGLAVTPDGRAVYVTDWSGDYSYLTAVDMRE